MSDGILVVRGLRRSFEQGGVTIHVLRGIDFEVKRGEIVALLGPSGSGKSTLLMVMAGLERPNDGRVVVAGEDLVRLDEDALARESRLPVGSSASRIVGSEISARATATRCCCPPESSAGR